MSAWLSGNSVESRSRVVSPSAIWVTWIASSGLVWFPAQGLRIGELTIGARLLQRSQPPELAMMDKIKVRIPFSIMNEGRTASRILRWRITYDVVRTRDMATYEPTHALEDVPSIVVGPG